ncbi:MAG: NifU family protein [Elusimicrobia bacterium]|nr:NifU family protein [Elusimicrobiota bacterium]MDE2237954.1 NifU family protein [Elusimicrobiota bacterium]MDE2424546.1 NifU family protein [Elusimicrobiota bacterium]
MREKVEKVIEKVRPFIQSDGGDITLVDVHEETGIVEVRLSGACHGCPSAAATLKSGVERMVKQDVPEIKEVVTV